MIIFLIKLYTSGFRGRRPAKTTTGSRETLENPPTGKLLREKNLKLATRGDSWGTAGGTAARATDLLGQRSIGSPRWEDSWEDSWEASWEDSWEHS